MNRSVRCHNADPLSYSLAGSVLVCAALEVRAAPLCIANMAGEMRPWSHVSGWPDPRAKTFQPLPCAGYKSKAQMRDSCGMTACASSGASAGSEASVTSLFSGSLRADVDPMVTVDHDGTMFHQRRLPGAPLESYHIVQVFHART